ncbi:MAG: hypothetical protein L0271_06055 [Gemmatimonadetes bacterium]|nr:hypothetical protein [Gemmatimonadota bacterium]
MLLAGALLDQGARRRAAPRILDERRELVRGHRRQTNQHGRVSVVVRLGEELPGSEPPWLLLSRGGETLTLFVTDDFPHPGNKVLFAYAGA